MTDEQRDPAAELRAFFDACARAVQAFAEQNRPLFDAVKALHASLAADPELRARVAARRNAAAEEYRPCYCLCAKTHPGDKGICEAFDAVTTRHYDTPLLGPVDVPLCAPCAAAQFLAEVTGRDH